MRKEITLSKIHSISQLKLRNLMIARAHLHRFIETSDMKRALSDILRSVTLIQYDPLNPAGRNHDIYLFNRLQYYRYAAFENTLYPHNMLFENYHDNLYAIDINKFPMYHTFAHKRFEHPYYLKRYKLFIKQHPASLESVLTYISENGMTNSSDLKHLGSVDSQYRLWKSGNVAGNALEYLWLQGKLVISKRDTNFRKYFDLTERYVPKNCSKKLNFLTMISFFLSYKTN